MDYLIFFNETSTVFLNQFLLIYILECVIKLDILKISKCNTGTSRESATALQEGRLPGSPPLKSIGAWLVVIHCLEELLFSIHHKWTYTQKKKKDHKDFSAEIEIKYYFTEKTTPIKHNFLLDFQDTLIGLNGHGHF